MFPNSYTVNLGIKKHSLIPLGSKKNPKTKTKNRNYKLSPMQQEWDHFNSKFMEHRSYPNLKVMVFSGIITRGWLKMKDPLVILRN